MTIDPTKYCTDHLDDSSPVLGDFGQVEGFREVYQVEDILLEARTTETLCRSADTSLPRRIAEL